MIFRASLVRMVIKINTSNIIISLASLCCFYPVFQVYGQDEIPTKDDIKKIPNAEIVIQGNLIEQDWMKTGASVELLNNEDLHQRPNSENLGDILETTTNMTLPTGAAKTATIRGIDGTGPAENANAFFAGSRPRLGVRLDGRPSNFNEIIYGSASLWDIERVEVLRGAQSMLVGRNAISGSVNITTKDPEFDLSGAAETSVTNYDTRRVSGMMNIPLHKDIALRLTADWQTGQSDITYHPFPGVENPGEIDSLNLRAKLLSYPNLGEHSEWRLTATHNSHRGPQGEIIVRPFKNRTSDYPEQPVHEITTSALSSSFDLYFADNWQFELDSSYTTSKFKRITAPNTSNGRVESQEVTLDPHIRYDHDNGFQGLIGAHYYHADQDEFIEFIDDQNFEDKTRTYAFYGEAVMPLGYQLDLTLGARYEKEYRRRKGGDKKGAIAKINSEQSFEAFLPSIKLNWQADETQSYGVAISKGYNAGGGGIAFGFPSPFPIIHYEYDPETVWNYEIYGRQKLLGGDLRLTQNLFYTQYSDMQLPFDLTPENTRDELFVVRNADRVTTYGLELGAQYQMTDAFSLFGNVGLLQTKVDEFPNSGVEKNQLFGSPLVTANAGLNWSYKRWQTNYSARYSDSYFTSISNNPRGKTDSSFIQDAKLSYNLGNFEIFTEVNNIFNEDPAVAFYPGESPDQDKAVLQQPRQIRFGASAKF